MYLERDKRGDINMYKWHVLSKASKENVVIENKLKHLYVRKIKY